MHKIPSSKKLHCRPIKVCSWKFHFWAAWKVQFSKNETFSGIESWWGKKEKDNGHFVGILIPLFLANSIVFAVGKCTASHLKDNGNPIKLNIYDFASIFLKQMTWYRNVSLCAIWLRDGTLLIKQFLSFFWSNFSKSNLLQKRYVQYKFFMRNTLVCIVCIFQKVYINQGVLSWTISILYLPCE